MPMLIAGSAAITGTLRQRCVTVRRTRKGLALVPAVVDQRGFNVLVACQTTYLTDIVTSG